jgi:hypothetical protein
MHRVRFIAAIKTKQASRYSSADIALAPHPILKLKRLLVSDRAAAALKSHWPMANDRFQTFDPNNPVFTELEDPARTLRLVAVTRSRSGR